MKYILTLILSILIISCTSVRYTAGKISSPQYIIDSIELADGIAIPPINNWLHSTLVSNDGVIITHTYHEKYKRDKYTLSIIIKDSTYYYKYRVE